MNEKRINFDGVVEAELRVSGQKVNVANTAALERDKLEAMS